MNILILQLYHGVVLSIYPSIYCGLFNAKSKQDLALNNPQELICHKTLTNLYSIYVALRA